jgi:translocation and assembly module TamB
MTDPTTPRPRRRWKKTLLVLGIFFAVLGAGFWYATTDSFQSYVRGRLVTEIERITGGRAEVGSFHVVPFHMQVEVRDITVHGSEAKGDQPLVHIDHLLAHVKLDSLLRTEFGFHSVTLDHPVVHVEIAPDGTTNLPRVPEHATGGNPIEPLFALSIDHLAVRQGELLWADRKIPLDFTVTDTDLRMDYSYLRGRYESRLTVGKVDTVFENFRPFAWMATVEFSLTRNFLEVKSLQWNSGRSSLTASGRINDFLNPQLTATYNAHADLAEIGAVARQPQLRSGTTELKGSGRWSLGSSWDDFSSSGSMTLRDLIWQDDQLALKKASATSDYSVTDQQIKLWKLQGKLFGGSFTGDAQVDNWLHSIPPAPPGKSQKGKENMPMISAARPPTKKGSKEKQPEVQTGVIHLRLRDLSAGDIAEALDVRSHPLHQFHPAGTAAGSMDASWRGSPKDSEVVFAFDVSPPAITLAGQTPLTARMQGKYHSAADALELSQFNLSTPASRLQAQGMLSASSSLHVSASTANLEEWRPLVTAFGGPSNLPFRLNGSATFGGVINGSFSSPTIAGNLTAQDFEYLLPAALHSPEQHVHWDSLATSVLFSAQALALRSGSLRRGDTTADFEVNATLRNGQFSDDSPYTSHINLHNVDIASTAALAGFNYPISGTVDASLQMTGTRAQPQVEGHVHAVNASAYGEEIGKLDADVHVANGEFGLNNIQLVHQDASVSGSAAYTPASRSFRLDLAGKDFDLARVRQIHLDPLPIRGRADFTLQGSGTSDAPVINATVQAHDLIFDNEMSGGLTLAATTKNGELQISGHSDFQRGSLSLEGTVGMHGDYPAKITAHTDHLDLDALWRAYLGQQLTGHSEVGGAVTMQGPLRHPSQWTLNGDLADIGIEFEYAKLHNQGPVQFTYADETIHIQPLHMIGEGTDVTGQGSIDFQSKHELELQADGQVDLKLLASINQDFTSSGLVLIHMKVNGMLHDPHPHGTVEFKNGSVNYAGLPSGLSEMNGSMTFTRDRVHIEQLTARTGGGTLDLKGDATSFNNQINFNVTAIGKDVRLRYPPGVSSTANAELHWVGNRSSSTVSGDIFVTKLAVTPGFDFGSYLERSRQSAAFAPANSPLYNIKLDVAVRTAPELQMKTAVARLSGDADLHLRGSVARPSVLGRADILEGEANFNGIKFRLERGDITFANPVAIEPQLDLQATTHVRNYDLDLTVTGTPDHLNVNYRSEPPLPKSDIIALLALGRTSEESEQLQQQSGQNVFSDEATAMIINQAINQTVSSRMQKLFGVSRIKIDPQGLATETNPTARGPQITIEQEFANNLSLTYSTNVSQSSQQIIEGEYFFTRNVSAVGTRDQNGVISFDVRIRKRKK